MSTRLRMPETARLIKSETLVIPIGPWAGKNVTFSLFEGYASKGYKSDYERVPHVWFRCEVTGERPQTWSYSGRRIGKAEEHYNHNIMGIKAEIAKNH